MSNLLWKKKKKEMKTKPKTKSYRTMKNGEKQKEKKKERETWTLFNTAYRKKRKKEQTFLIKQTVHRLKKEEKKTEHSWTVIAILFWLVVKWKCLSLKATLENFFFSCSYYEIWRKPLTEDFILGLLIIVIILILNVFLEFGFSWNRKYLGGGSVLTNRWLTRE